MTRPSEDREQDLADLRRKARRISRKAADLGDWSTREEMVDGILVPLATPGGPQGKDPKESR